MKSKLPESKISLILVQKWMNKLYEVYNNFDIVLTGSFRYNQIISFLFADK